MKNMTAFVFKYVLLALIGTGLLVVPMFGVIDDFWSGMGGGLPVSYTHLTLPTICSV